VEIKHFGCLVAEHQLEKNWFYLGQCFMDGWCRNTNHGKIMLAAAGLNLKRMMNKWKSSFCHFFGVLNTFVNIKRAF